MTSKRSKLMTFQIGRTFFSLFTEVLYMEAKFRSQFFEHMNTLLYAFEISTVSEAELYYQQ